MSAVSAQWQASQALRHSICRNPRIVTEGTRNRLLVLLCNVTESVTERLDVSDLLVSTELTMQNPNHFPSVGTQGATHAAGDDASHAHAHAQRAHVHAQRLRQRESHEHHSRAGTSKIPPAPLRNVVVEAAS